MVIMLHRTSETTLANPAAMQRESPFDFFRTLALPTSSVHILHMLQTPILRKESLRTDRNNYSQYEEPLKSGGASGRNKQVRKQHQTYAKRSAG